MPIINTVIQGGGTTPTGTKNITANGVYDVTNFASADVQVPTTAPAYYIERAKDANNKLVMTNSIINLSGVTDIGDYVLSNTYRGNTNLTGALNLSSLTAISGIAACVSMFYGCTGITSADLSSLTTISSSSGVADMFRNCSGLTSVNLSSLTTISGSASCQEMFYDCSQLSSIDLSSLTTISAQQACQHMFRGCIGLTSINFPLLTTFSGQNSGSNMFYGCTSLTSVNFPSLTYFGSGSNMFEGCTSLTSVNFESLSQLNASGFYYTFKGCTGLENISFPSLSSVNSSSFYYAFYGCSNLRSITFYALTPSSFPSYGGTDAFNNMLSRVTGCTVHFPMAIQSTIGSWAAVTNGFGGTNTTVLFDIVTSLTGTDSNTYTRSQKNSTATATAWTYNDTLYYTSGTTEPQVGDTIYSDSACTTAVTTISTIA